MTTPPHRHTKFNYAIKMLQIMRTFVTLQNVANEAHCIRNIDKILIIFPGKGTRGGGNYSMENSMKIKITLVEATGGKALVCSKHKSSKSCFVGDNLS